MLAVGKKYKFLRTNNLVDIIGYVLFEDQNWITVKVSDLTAPDTINKQFIHTYKEVVA